MRLIDLCASDRNIRTVALTHEEEGVAMLAGDGSAFSAARC